MKPLPFALLLTVVFGAARQSDAAAVKYQFSGTGSLSEPTALDSPWRIPAGEYDFSGVFVYDAANTIDPLVMLDVAFGGTDFSLDPYSPVARDTFLYLGRGRSYVAREVFEGYAVTNLEFQDEDSSILDAAVFPGSLALSDYDSVSLRISALHGLCPIDAPAGQICLLGFESDIEFRGVVTSLSPVPEPTTTMLVAITSLSSLSAWYIRRYRRQKIKS